MVSISRWSPPPSPPTLASVSAPLAGAGKTHTMLGVDAEPGIYLQTLTDLFQAIEEIWDSMDYSVSMSYLEIYNEVIRDLPNPSSGFLDLSEDSRGSIQIAGIMEFSSSNAHEIMQLLTKGNQQRTQEPTATNKTSSRSHTVLQVTVYQRSCSAGLVKEVHMGRLFMVDLAGSERASQVPVSVVCLLRQGLAVIQAGVHVKRNLLNVSYRIAQYTEVISDLRREIAPQIKNREEKEKKSEAGIQDARGR
ncbi:kinesin-like protein KIF19 [Cebus imitator]|uniref:kinesin-like protein KIF19 n=1 Tax=Cebus imitator TaxID=2715852 RepID=UPI00189B7A51|nr:kinesin-like protein KIF19 [Cebus imitator]